MKNAGQKSLPSAMTITEAAKAAILEVMESQKVPANYCLRVGMRGGGCGGMSYLLGFDEQKDTDLTYVVAGLSVVVDRAHSMYVLGMEIDWHEDEHQKGFVFNNPAERKSTPE